MDDNVDEFWNELATQHENDQRHSKLSSSSALRTPRKDASFVFTPDANGASEDQVLSERPPMLPDWRCAVVRLLCELGECRSFVDTDTLHTLQQMFTDLTVHVDVARDADLFFGAWTVFVGYMKHKSVQGSTRMTVRTFFGIPKSIIPITSVMAATNCSGDK